MLLPIGLDRLNSVAFLVVVSAAGGITAQAATLAFSSVFPGIASERIAAAAVKASFFTLLGAGSVGLLIFCFSMPLGLAQVSSLLLWSSILTLVQGAYLLVITHAVRRNRYASISWTRFWYGVLNVLVTGLCLVMTSAPYNLALAACLNFGLAATVCLYLDRETWRETLLHLQTASSADTRAYVKEHTRSGGSVLLASSAYQASTFSIVGLGVLGPAWSIVIRIGSGFSSLARSVVSPTYEIALGTAVRAGDMHDVHAASVATVRAGYKLGALASVGVIVGLNATSSLRFLPQDERLGVSLIAISFVMATITPSVAVNNLLMLGGGLPSLMLVLVKALTTVAVLLWAHGLLELGLLAANEAVYCLVYFVLVARQVRLI